MAIPEGESAYMAICRDATLPCHIEDWRSEPDAVEKLQNFVVKDREQGFDLSRAPLLRLGMFRMEDKAWEIVINNHHITLDGWSLSVVLADCAETLWRRSPSPSGPFQQLHGTGSKHVPGMPSSAGGKNYWPVLTAPTASI